uniref:Uncharacterized protein n=1 Tax=Rhizophora mucronata TaxID=61149 RepID=A0A2P2IQR7_RHIMU
MLYMLCQEEIRKEFLSGFLQGRKLKIDWDDISSYRIFVANLEIEELALMEKKKILIICP